MFVGPTETVNLECQPTDTIRDVAKHLQTESGWIDFDFVIEGNLINANSGKQFFELPISAGIEIDVVINKHHHALTMLDYLGIANVSMSYYQTRDKTIWGYLWDAEVPTWKYGENLLQKACKNPDTTLDEKLNDIKYLIQYMEYDLNAVTYSNRSILYLVMNRSDYDLVDGLLSLGADLNKMSSPRYNVLHESVKTTRYNFLSKCLSLGMNPDLPDHRGNSALIIACELGDRISESLLITGGADENFTSPNGDTPSLARQRYEMTMSALDEDGDDFDMFLQT